MKFELQPTLTSDLLTLRPLREEDWDELLDVASDPLIWEQHPNNDRWKEDVFREFFDGAMASGGAFVVIDSTDGKIIGSTRYNGYDAEKSQVEIGWTFLECSHWGGTYNGEMKRLLIEHAFGFVENVIFMVGIDNLRSQKALEKIGATRIDRRPNSAGRDSFVYRITSPS